MKKILRFLGVALAVFFAAILGNVIGDAFRALITKTAPRVSVSSYNAADDETTIAVQPLISNVLPAWVLGALIRPHALTALLTGALAGLLLSDRYEQRVRAWFGEGLAQQGDFPQVDEGRVSAVEVE